MFVLVEAQTSSNSSNNSDNNSNNSCSDIVGGGKCLVRVCVCVLAYPKVISSIGKSKIALEFLR